MFNRALLSKQISAYFSTVHSAFLTYSFTIWHGTLTKKKEYIELSLSAIFKVCSARYLTETRVHNHSNYAPFVDHAEHRDTRYDVGAMFNYGEQIPWKRFWWTVSRDKSDILLRTFSIFQQNDKEQIKTTDTCESTVIKQKYRNTIILKIKYRATSEGTWDALVCSWSCDTTVLFFPV